MKKSAFGYAFILFTSASIASAASLHSIRIFQTSEQFSQAVTDGRVFVDFSRGIPLRRNGADVSSTYIEKTMTTENSDGTKRVLTMACSLHLQSTIRHARIAATVGKPRNWKVVESKRVGHADLLVLKKEKAPLLEIMCYARELDQSTMDVRPIPMTASMIDRVLSEAGGRVKTSVHPEELRFLEQPLNDGLAQ